MTGFAYVAGSRMSAEFAGCDIAVVATYTGIGRLAVIDGLEKNIPAGTGDMAAVT